ncbi:uncharacterized protein I303_105536 [Kwoniella dejecticola CBS 10117]|uniref:Serine/threonine protein kinase n=1 Tax=Kwoniella dejecticola CBS 10117 TaxID=1296121 RepID=A0A1A6A273_9TREE|nr:serine/threonine protein kinase [Kwoniella dejecticola CBS 10117]OBR84165.1 serine/threonine protein kinase [Kwoniella dejecticola CBS 10117]
MDDGTWSTPEDIEAARITVKSAIFQSLDLIEVNTEVHYAKIPRSIREIENLLKVKGVPHVVQIVGRTSDGKVVLERFGQNLKQWITDKITARQWNFSEEEKIQWILDIAQGLASLHERGIIHKDLTMNNILFEKNRAIICDLKSGDSSIDIRPPEFVQKIQLEFNEKMDVYGFGVVLWSIENRNNARPHRILQPSGIFEGGDEEVSCC